MSKSYNPYKTYNQLSTPDENIKKDGRVFEADSLHDVEDKIKGSKYTIVDIYANWCGPCKSFKPIFSDLSLKYKNITFISFDIDKVKDDNTNRNTIFTTTDVSRVPIFTTKDVSGVPTFKFYVNIDSNITMPFPPINGGSRNEIENILNQMI